MAGDYRRKYTSAVYRFGESIPWCVRKHCLFIRPADVLFALFLAVLSFAEAYFAHQCWQTHNRFNQILAVIAFAFAGAFAVAASVPILQGPLPELSEKLFWKLDKANLFMTIPLGAYIIARIHSLPIIRSQMGPAFRSLFDFFGPLSPVIGAFILSGIAFYTLRLMQKCLIIYAYFELLFGFVSFYIFVDKARTVVHGSAMAGICASIFVFVRGLEHAKKAFADDEMKRHSSARIRID
jgi:hypothetical protein